LFVLISFLLLINSFCTHCDCPPQRALVFESLVFDFVSDYDTNPIVGIIQAWALHGDSISSDLATQIAEGTKWFLIHAYQYQRPLSTMSQESLLYLLCRNEERLRAGDEELPVPYHQFAELIFKKGDNYFSAIMERNGKFELKMEVADPVAGIILDAPFLESDGITLKKVIDYIKAVGKSKYEPLSNCQTQSNTVMMKLAKDVGLDPKQFKTNQCLSKVVEGIEDLKKNCVAVIGLGDVSLAMLGGIAVLMSNPMGWVALGAVGINLLGKGIWGVSLFLEQNLDQLEGEIDKLI